jgi:hypothetical protein
MPYVHQKTWVQLAPKIRNLSLKESPWGMGQAPFPATPCYDDSGNVIDCGGSSAGLTIVNPLPGQDTYTGYSLPASSSPSTSPSTTPNSLAAWFQANQSMVLLGGVALFGLALISGMGRR